MYSVGRRLWERTRQSCFGHFASFSCCWNLLCGTYTSSLLWHTASTRHFLAISPYARFSRIPGCHKHIDCSDSRGSCGCCPSMVPRCVVDCCRKRRGRSCYHCESGLTLMSRTYDTISGPQVSVILPALNANPDYLRCIYSIRAALGQKVDYEIVSVVRHQDAFAGLDAPDLRIIPEVRP